MAPNLSVILTAECCHQVCRIPALQPNRLLRPAANFLSQQQLRHLLVSSLMPPRPRPRKDTAEGGPFTAMLNPLKLKRRASATDELDVSTGTTRA